LIDTVIFSQSTAYGLAIAAKLRAGDVATAVGIGIPRDAFIEQLGQPPDEFTTELVRPLVEKAALVQAINDAWAMIAVLTASAVLLILLVRRGQLVAGSPLADPQPI
jgi:DHA2 family multidrug resistance protein